MLFTRLGADARHALMQDLAAMPAYLREEIDGLDPDVAAAPGPDGAFAPVEQVWHLADLEAEGFNFRIARLLESVDLCLPDFDGGAGTQDGVGGVSLCNMPLFLHQHDAAHKPEIAAWRAALT